MRRRYEHKHHLAETMPIRLRARPMVDSRRLPPANIFKRNLDLSTGFPYKEFTSGDSEDGDTK